MKSGVLKFSEIFAILAMFFLLLTVVLTQDTPIYIVNLDDSLHPSFESASATPTPEFIAQLDEKLKSEIIPKIKRHNYNVIEIVGHTDTGRFTFNKKKNWTKDTLFEEIDKKMAFDTNIFELVNEGVTEIDPPNNPSLGIMRALAVRHYLKQKQETYPVLKRIEYILPYTAGQFIGLDYSIATGYKSEPREGLKVHNARLRRIEIRLLSDKMWEESQTSN